MALSTFSDVDCTGITSDRRSTRGYCVFLGPNLLSWSAKKQAIVARSSTKVEYKALANVATEIEIVWLLQVFKDLQVHHLITSPTLWCDNISALSLATIHVFHAHTKHVEVDFHFVREKIALKQLCVRHVPSGFQIANILTKPLTVAKFLILRDKLKLTCLLVSVCDGLITNQNNLS